jgi:hypothetical protein
VLLTLLVQVLGSDILSSIVLQLITIMVTHGMATAGVQGRKYSTVKLINMLLLVAALAAPAAQARKLTIACSPFVYPCHCGLCPHIVDCKTKVSAECFCGTAAPGSYPHPDDKTKFWMCSYDSQALVKHGVEVACPSRLVYDPVVKVCTFPATAAQSAASGSKGPAASAAVVPAGASAAGTAAPSSKSATASSQGGRAGGSSSVKQAQQKPESSATMVERAPAAGKP